MSTLDEAWRELQKLAKEKPWMVLNEVHEKLKHVQVPARHLRLVRPEPRDEPREGT